jgi:hypothetical protein
MGVAAHRHMTGQGGRTGSGCDPPTLQDPKVSGFYVAVGGAVMCRKDRAEGGSHLLSEQWCRRVTPWFCVTP